MTSGKQLVLSLLLLGSFGCEYTAEDERPETRVMENMGACPEEDTVTAEENGVDSDRTTWRRLPQSPICYYHATENDRARYPLCAKATTDGLDQVYARAKETFKRKESGEPGRTAGDIDCMAEGMVLVVPADGLTCADEAPQKGSWKTAGVDVGSLIASDYRPTLRVCNYDLTYEYTRRPFSCGGAKMGFAP